MKRAFCILLVLCMLTSLTAFAENPETDAHTCTDFGPVYGGFTWMSISEDGDRMRGYIIDVYGNRLSEDPYEISNRYFNEGLVTVWKDGRAGCIDENGQVVIPFEWDDIWNFHHGAAIA